MKGFAWRSCAAAALFGLAACNTGGISASDNGPYAPGVDLTKEAVDGVEVGHRLIAAGEYELAIRAFTRAALENGMDAEILSGLGSANLGLGRLGQAETLLRRATAQKRCMARSLEQPGCCADGTGQNSRSAAGFPQGLCPRQWRKCTNPRESYA